jgi:hypothetical protein
MHQMNVIFGIFLFVRSDGTWGVYLGIDELGKYKRGLEEV